MDPEIQTDADDSKTDDVAESRQIEDFDEPIRRPYQGLMFNSKIFSKD